MAVGQGDARGMSSVRAQGDVATAEREGDRRRWQRWGGGRMGPALEIGAREATAATRDGGGGGLQRGEEEKIAGRKYGN